jgi:hypothetical protein
MSSTEPIALWMALCLVAAPALIGWALGRWAYGPQPVATLLERLLITSLPPLVALGLDLLSPRVDLWDALGVASCLGLGLLAATWPAARVGGALAGLALFLSTAELGTRLALPPGPEFAGDRAIGAPWLSRNPTRLSETTCHAIFPELDHGRLASIRAAHLEPGQPVVLHLGDSLLVFPPQTSHADPAADPARFPLLLDAADPERSHVNLGFPGASYDALLRVARTWLARYEVDQIVLYAFLENDLAELGRPYPCCRDGLVDVRAFGAPTLCASPSPPTFGSPRLEHLLVRSRDPIVVRVLSEWSSLARHLRARAQQLSAVRGPWSQLLDADDHRLSDGDLQARWAMTRTLLDALRRDAEVEGASLLVVALPIGPDLRGVGKLPERSLRPRVEALGELCGELGIGFVDAWPAIEEQPQPWTGLFMDDGYHLSLEGHAVMGEWLIKAAVLNPR